MDILLAALPSPMWPLDTISRIDNAAISANVLATIGKMARRWFLTWA